MDDPKFHIVPGKVISRNDGDKHYVSSVQLAHLYELSRHEWVVCVPMLCTTSVPHLFPRSDGKYGRPKNG